MILMGIATLLYGFYEFLEQEKELERGEFKAKVAPMFIYTSILIVLAIMLVISLYIAI